MTIVYRANDPISGRWSGLGRLLTTYEFDLNVYQFDQRITTLEANYALTVSLASISQPTPSTLLFTLTDASTQGPFTLPVSAFHDRGDWAATTVYAVNDTFIAPNGGLYRVIYPLTSAGSFSPTANDGLGHDYYAAMIPPRGNVIPAGGAEAMYFRKNSSTDYDGNWAFIRATEVTFSPSTASTLTSTNVSDALEELDVKVDALGTGPVAAIDVSFSPSTASGLTSTNVAAALEELAADSTGFPPASDGYNASPAGNVSTTEKAMGLGGSPAVCKFTPTKTGNLLVWFAGVAFNATAVGDGTTITGRYGLVSDGVPANAATTGLGTAFGLPQHFIGSTTSGQQGFVVMGLISGLTVGVQYWFDLSLVAVTAGGASVKDVQWLALEVTF